MWYVPVFSVFNIHETKNIEIQWSYISFNNFSDAVSLRIGDGGDDGRQANASREAGIAAAVGGAALSSMTPKRVSDTVETAYYLVSLRGISVVLSDFFSGLSRLTREKSNAISNR